MYEPTMLSVPVSQGGRGRRRGLLSVLLVLAIVLGLALAVPAFADVGSKVDNGFESGVSGAPLATPPWTVNGAPQQHAYDATKSKIGSKSAWIQGPTTASNAGVAEASSAGMSANGAEIRFWVYFPNTTGVHLLDDWASGVATADRADYIQFAGDGNVYVQTDKAGNPNGYTSGTFTPVGSYTAGWTQFRIAYTFSGTGAQTYTLSKRSGGGDVWTPLRAAGAAGYGIPFRGTNTIAATHGTLWRGYQGASMWLDDVLYSATGVSEIPAVPSGLAATPGTSQVGLSWTANTEADLAGYKVYRDGSALTALPITATTYTDPALAAGSYAYQVSAIDTSGNESVRSPAVLSGPLAPPVIIGTLIDNGFESGPAGTALASPPWSLNGAPQHHAYDATRSKIGAKSAWIQGPVTASNAGVAEAGSAGLSSNGAQITFWTYFDDTAGSRLLDDWASGVATTDRADFIQFGPGGTISIQTDRTGNPNGYTSGAFTPVGTYTTGWTQFKIAYTFTGSGAQTYTLSKRASASDAWTPLKAAGASGYAIPFRGTNTISATHGTLWRAFGNAQFWLDDLRTFATGQLTVTPSAGAGGSIAPADPQTLAYGTDSPTFSIAPAPGFVVSDVLVDGTSVGARGTYKFSAVTADHTISATFALQAANDMVIETDCSVCHGQHHHGPDCLHCHNMTDSHPGTATAIHQPADLSACGPCHNSSLTVEHAARTTSTGGAISCATCHTSKEAAVVSAIANKLSGCTYADDLQKGCHGAPAHTSATPKHVAALAKCTGDGCHSGDLPTIHTTLNCADCHTASGTAACITCHPDRVNFDGSVIDHGFDAANHTSTETCLGGCHQAQIKANHDALSTPVTCAQCHVKRDALGGPWDKTCSACHPTIAHASANHTAVLAPATITISGVDFPNQDCNGCHASNLTAIHGTDCTKCHPTLANTLTGGWGKGCVQGGCHTAGSSAPMHDSINTVHVIPAARADCLVSGCHDAGGIKPFAGKSVAELHKDATTVVGGQPRSSCMICHAAGVTPTTDCLTSGCHPDRADPHGYDAATHTGTPTATTYTILGTTYPSLPCANCHSTELGVEHTKSTSAGNTGCTECHAVLVSQLPQPWNKTTCAQGNCHAGSSSDPLHGGISAAHTRLTSASNNACFASGCHADGNLASIHANASGTVAGQTRTSCMLCHATGVPTTSDCTVCHADKVASHYDTSQHTATFGTANMTILGVDFGGHSCSECHQSADLGTIHTGGCATCHPTPASSAKPWNKSCATGDCHTSGTNAQHAQLDSAHEVGAQTCTADGCHTGGGNLAAIHTKAGCSACHGDGVTPSANCEDCHDLGSPHGDLDSIHASNLDWAPMTFFDGQANHDWAPVEVNTECTMCHSANLLPQHGYACSTCHSDSGPVSGLGGWDGGCQQGDCHQDIHENASSGHDSAYSDGCSSCHDYVGDVWGPPPGDYVPNVDSSREWCGNCHSKPNDVDPPVTTSDAVDTYTGETAVINLSATDDDYVRETYYQVDDGQIQSGARVVVAVAGEHTLQFWSVDAAYHAEDRNAVTFTLEGGDVTPPTTTSDVKASYAYRAEVNLTAADTGAGVASTSYKLDSGPVVLGNIVSTTVPGPHTLEFWSEDAAGNVENPHKTASFTVVADTTPPTTTSNAVAVYSGTATINFFPSDTGGSGVATTYHKLDGGSAIAGTSMTLTTPGSHTVEFWSTDVAGNIETAKTASFVLNPDTIAPVTYVSVASYLMSNNTNIHLLASDAGGSGLAHTYFYRDGVGPTEGTWAYFSGEGPHSLTMWSTDNAGNIEVSHTTTFTLDVTKPTTTSDAQASYVGPATIHLTPTDGVNGSGVAATYYKDGAFGTQQTGTTAVIQPPASGSPVAHVLWFWSVDRAGNVETASNRSFTVAPVADTTPPSGTMSVNNNATYATTTAATVNSAVTDTGSGMSQMRIDPGTGTYGSWIAYAASSAITLPVGDGTKTVNVQYRDVAGNVLTLTDTIVLDATAPAGTMSVNSNAAYATSTAATVNSSVTDAVSGIFQMSIDPGTGTYGSWIAYAASSPITLPTGDGTKTIHVQYKDNAGNVVTLTDTIVLDTTAPAGTMSVNNNAATTNTTAVTVNSAVTDAGSGMYQMSIDPGTGTYGSWIAYAASSAITLPTGDGVKTVHAQYKDNAGNIVTLTDTITLVTADTTPPSGTMSVNNGATYATTTAATVNSAVTDSGSGMSQMSIDPGTGTYGSAIAYAASSPITLPTGDGTKTVRVQYRDVAGNVLTLTDTIVLDATAPAGTMSVNNNAAYATSTAATVNSSVTDAGSGIYQMSIDPGTGTYGSWIAYAASSPIALPTGDGIKTVRVQYKDNAGNIATLTDTIVLDATAPAGTMSVNNNAATTNTTAVTVNSAVTDAGSGMYQMSIDPGTGTYGSWIAYAASSPITLPTGDGIKTVRVQYKDNAGNIATLTDTITLVTADTTPPTTTSDVQASYLGGAVVHLTATDNTGGSGVAATYFKLDGGAQTSGTTISTSVLGSHTLEFWSVDNAANTETHHNESFSVDTGQSFSFIGDDQTFVVPAGVTSIALDMYGAQGGMGGGSGDGGLGGRVQATVPVTPGWVITVRVGGKGADSYDGGAGGWPNGGLGSNGSCAGAGGGSTSILHNGAVLVEAGAGGGGNHEPMQGGSGGWQGYGAGGNEPGQDQLTDDGGGGGGGWNGGFGSYDHDPTGGGSSYVALGVGTLTEGVHEGDGSLTITWNAPPADTTPPSGTMSVNNNATYATTTAATVNSAVTDTGSGMSQMSIDPGTGTYGSWIAYAASSPITLPTGDGTKTVRVQYRDVAGNVLTLTDTIVLDATAPAGTMSVNSNAAYATSTAATVNSSVTDAVSGIFQMSIDPGTGTYGSWIAYAASSPITLPTGDGTKTVHVQYKDNAGNVVTLTDTIVLDTTAPTGTMTVNNNATFANSVAATVNSSVTDAGSGIYQMSIDPGTGTYGSWIAYAASSPITLPAGDGTKTVHVQYKDNAGNIVTLTDTIILDTTAPTGTMAVDHGSASTISTLVTVDSSVSDAVSGVGQMSIDPGTGVYGSWTVYSASASIVLPDGLGTKTVRVQYKDNAGNLLTLTDTIELIVNDTTSPAGTMLVSNGAFYATTTAATVNSNVTDSESGMGLMSIDPGTGTYGSWIAYAASSPITLPAGDGTKTVRVEYKDNAGNVLWLMDSIVLDTTGPTGTMSVNSNATYATSTAATVNSSMTDALGSVIQMSIDPGTGTYGSWISYAVSSAITMPTGDGTKTIRVQYKDSAGNVSTTTDTIVLDTTPPNGTVQVGNHANAANSTATTVNSAVTDSGSGMYQMAIDPGSGTYGAWIAYAASSPIMLPSGDGTKFIRVNYKDNAGNTRNIITAVTLDTVAPLTTSDAAASYNGPATIHLTGNDTGTGVAATYYRLDGGTQTQGTVINVPAPSSGSVGHSIEFWSMDNADNVETTHKTASFTVSTAAGLTTTFIDESPYAYDNAIINLNVSNATGGASTYYRLDGWDDQFNYDGPFQIYGAGEHTLEYWSVDSHGEESHHVAVITVAPGDPDDSHDIRVRVIQNGDPVEGAEVILCSAQDPDSDYAGWNWGYHIYTDSDGYAVWEGMPGRPGGYRARLVDASARAYFWEATPGYTGDIDAKTLDFDTDETGVVHVNVHDSDGNPVANANVHAEFVQSGDVAQDNGGSEVYGSTDGSGLCDLSLRPTHQAMQVYAEVNGQVVYSDEFHVDVYGASVDVDVTLNP